MSEEFRGDNLIIFQSYPLLCLRWFVPCSFVQPNPETEMCLSSELCRGDHRSVFSDGVLFFATALLVQLEMMWPELFHFPCCALVCILCTAESQQDS